MSARRVQWHFALVTAAALLPLRPAQGQAPGASRNLSWGLSLRTRYEHWTWFDTGNPLYNNDYGWGAALLKASVRYDSRRWWDLLVEAQNSTFLGAPDDARAPAPQGELGAGASHFTPHGNSYDTRVFLNQGYLTLKSPAHQTTYLRLGRFDYTDGAEVMTGDPSLDWIKRARINGRLIANIGFSQVQRTFDGFTAAYDRPRFDVTAMATHPRQGGFELDGWKDMSKVDMAGLTVTLKPGTILPASEGRLFYMYYGDRRGPADAVVKADNRPAAARGADSADIALSIFGLHFLKTGRVGSGQGDAMVWAVYQTGSWGLLDHRAWAVALEAGFQLPAAPWKPWLRVGYNRSTGDADNGDRVHRTYFQALTTVRPFALFPFYNMMNNDDLFLQLLLKPVPGKLGLRSDFHRLRLTESGDLWYSGSGAFQNQGSFGFSGRPSGGSRDLGRLLDLSVEWNPLPHLNVQLYYGHAFGGDVIGNLYARRNGDLGYAEMTVRY